MMRINHFLSCGLLVAALAPSVALGGELSVEIDARPHPSDGSGEVTAIVRNSGEGSLDFASVPGWTAVGGLTVKITGPDDTITVLAPTGAAPDASVGYTLDANTSLGVSRTIEAGTFESPGTYAVVVEFESSNGTVASEPAHINVR